MAQDVLITPDSGKIEFKNNTTVSASIVLDAADSNLNLPSGTDVHFQNTTGTAPFIVDSTTKVTNLNADSLDGVSSLGFVRGDGTNNGATTIKADDADFIVQDSTDGTTNFIWRDHSAGELRLGTSDANVTMRSDVIIETLTSNSDPGADDLLLNGYGMMGSRASSPVYVTNFGAGGIQIGSGGAHNASNIAKFTTTETNIQQGNLKITSGNLTIGTTERINSTGAFFPASINGTGKISFLNGSSALGIRVESLYAGTSYAADASGAGYVDALNGYKVGGTAFIDSDLNIFTSGNITAGNSTGDEGYVRAYHSTAGEYLEMRGYGLQFNRSANYIRPTSDADKTLYLGASDATLDWNAIHFRSTNGLYMTGTQFLTTDRALVNIAAINTTTLTIGSATANNAILKLQEGDVTGDPTWWTVADGGSYSLRLNNLGTYPIVVTTNATNDAVLSVDIGYKLNVDSTLEVDGAATFNEPAIFNGDADETVVKIIKAFDSADEPGALLVATDADAYDDLSFEIRGNATGASVDTTTTMTSADTTFAVFGNGHTVIGYNNLGTTYTAVGTYGLNVSGGVSTTTGYWLGATQWMDSSRNLSSIGTISSGNLTVTGTQEIVSSSDQSLTLNRAGWNYIGFSDSSGRNYYLGQDSNTDFVLGSDVAGESWGIVNFGSVDFGTANITGVTDIYVNDQIISTGDTNTYMQFHAADQWRVVTGGGERLEINNTNTTVSNNLIVSGTATISSQLVADSYIMINKTATATATNTVYPSQDLYFRASGWDTNNTVARNVEWVIRNEPISNIYPDMDLSFYEESPTFGHKKFVLHGRGSGTNYQNANSATFYGNVTILKTFDTAGISGDAEGGDLSVTDGDINLGDGVENTRLIIKKADNDVSDHIQFFVGSTRMGEIGSQDTTWLRINQVTAKNIYTPRYIRADGGFFVDGSAKGIDGTGNFVGGGSVTAGAGTFTSIAMGNGAITGVDRVEINDPGEGIVWKAGANGDITLATIDDAADNILALSGTGATFRAPVIDIDGQGTFFSDSAGRIATTADFYVQPASGNTYLYSTNTYLGNTSGDNILCRGNTISGTSWSMTGGGVLSTSGTITITGAAGENALTLSGTSPTVAFTDTTTSADNFYLHINSNIFYILADRDGTGAYGAWETPHPLQLESGTNIGYMFGSRVFRDDYHPNADAWTTSRTITLGGDLSGNVSINGSANVTLTATVADDSHNHIISNVDGLQTALDAKLATPGSQEGATFKKVMSQYNRWGANVDMNGNWDEGVYGGFSTMTNGPSGMSYDPFLVMGSASDVRTQTVVPRTASRPIAYRGLSGTGTSLTSWHYSGWTTTVGDADLSIYAKKSGADNLVVTKAHPKLILDSPGSGDNFTSQGAQISLGESGDGGAAAVHITYTGDGKGRMGMGALSAAGVPSIGEVKWTYNSDIIQIPTAALTVGGALTCTSTSDATFTGDLQVNGNQVRTNSVGARVKYSVWTGSTYGIGMETGYTFGAISNDYVMSFQMNDASNRGFWWGDAGHTNAQGAMALSTDGYLTVATGARIGYGQSDTTHPVAGLQVSGDVVATGTIYANSTEELISGNVTGTLFADVIVANKIETDMLKANTITTGLLAADIITTTQLQISNDGTGAGIFMDGANARIIISDS